MNTTSSYNLGATDIYLCELWERINTPLRYMGLKKKVGTY